MIDFHGYDEEPIHYYDWMHIGGDIVEPTVVHPRIEALTKKKQYQKYLKPIAIKFIIVPFVLFA
jgi:hypothetical protein